MRTLKLSLVLIAFTACGCASFVRLELPEQFKGKKLKEDPPITMNHPCAILREA